MTGEAASQSADLSSISYRAVRPVVLTALEAIRYTPLTTCRETLKITRRAAYLAAAILRAEEAAQRIATNEIRESSCTDPVTGIDNRKGYDRNVREGFSQALAQKRPLTIVTLDLNDIDVVNVEQGRQEGDRWIKTTASILQNSCPRRPARWGGDEYGVVLDDVDERATQDWWSTVCPQFDDAGIHVSAGAATYYPLTGTEDLDAAIRQTHEEADAALYTAKNMSKQEGVSFLLTSNNISPGTTL